MANKRNKKVDENVRLINQLPDEIVLSSILSCLTIKELARTRLVSRHWNRIYHHISVLDFDKSSTKQKIRSHELATLTKDEQILEQEKCSYVNWVNHVVSKHVGSTIDQFKLSFDLNNSHKSHIDKWVIWALSKHVQILELDFTCVSIFYVRGSENKRYFLDESLFKVVKLKVKPVLTCLCLKSVNVTTQAVEHLLECCCSTLENLCIEESEHLTSMRIRNSVEMKSLKYLKVFGCKKLEIIDISAPKLLCFTYELGSPLGFRLLRIANASSLSRVSIEVERVDCLLNAFASLLNCVSHLEYLKLRWYLYPNTKTVIHSPPVLANLKHLELCVYGCGRRTLAGWIPLIKACPRLQRLTLQIRCSYIPYLYKTVICDKHPLWCLKTLEIIGYRCSNVDLDVANFVLENGVSLQEVILQPPESVNYPKKPDPKILRDTLDLKIPRGAALVPKIDFGEPWKKFFGPLFIFCNYFPRDATWHWFWEDAG